MLHLLLCAYILVKWVGAFSQLHWLAGGVVIIGMLFFARISVLSSLNGPWGLAKLVKLILTLGGSMLEWCLLPALWLVLILLYIFGVVDWLVMLNVIESNQGYILSHARPPVLDIVLLIFTIYTFIASIVRVNNAT